MGRCLAFEVVLGGAGVGEDHEFLYIVDLAAGFFQPVGEGGAQGVAGGARGDAGGMDGSGDGPLNAAGVQVMPLDRKGAGVYGQVTRGEDILPFLRSTYSAGFVCRGVFTGQGRGHGDREIGVSLVEAAYPLEVSAQALEELFVIGQECHPVAVGFGVVDDDEQVLEVEVLDAQAQGFEQPQTAAVEEAGDEVRHGVELGEDAQAFVMTEVGLDVGGSLGTHDVEVVKRKAEDIAVQEQEGRESLVLSGGSNLFLGGKVAEELFDFGCPHCAGVAESVEADKTFVPLDIGFLSADGVSAQADSFADAVGEFFLWHGFCSLDFLGLLWIIA